MKSLSITFITLLLFQTVWAQKDSANLIKYTPDFKFKDGIFLTFEAVKRNEPIPKERIVTNVDPKDFDFFLKILKHETFRKYGNLGEVVEVDVKGIWGFADKGVLYINKDNEFNRIPIVGTICQFVVCKVKGQEVMMNPTMHNGYYHSNGYDNASRQPTQEVVQYIFDFETGKIMHYNRQNVSIALMTDTELYDEYKDLSRRKREKKKFYYIRQFNKRNPLYLPLN